MTDKHLQDQADQSNMKKDPADWVTGDEPMTGAQKSYLKTLSEEAHEPFDENLSKAEASRRIDELQSRTGRTQSRTDAGQALQPAEASPRTASDKALANPPKQPSGDEPEVSRAERRPAGAPPDDDPPDPPMQ